MPAKQTSLNRTRQTLVQRSATRSGKVQRAATAATEWEALQRSAAEPRSVSPVQVLALQRTAGNQAVSRLIQTKLSVGAAGDEYEQEADQVADQVMRMPLAPTVQHGTEDEELESEPVLQRTAAEPELAAADESVIQRTDSVEKPARLHIHTDLDAPKLGLAELLQGAVGHSWVSLEWKDPTTVPADMQAAHQPFLARGGKFADPMGFWPKMFHAYDPLLDEWQSLPPGQRVGYSTNPFSSYVPGQMLHPDNMHTPKATQSYELTRDEADNVIDYAESKRDAEYSVYFYNCTTFAKEAVEVAGKKPPSLSTLGICYPNALYEGIVKNQKAGVGTTEVDPLNGGAVTRVEGEEQAPKKK
ncbi:hypothetical protein TFLX_03007 [Thermoflexales bacterium]|nr:hypothetical protein TFLX_03007 [Thermoflexales bacterium]